MHTSCRLNETENQVARVSQELQSLHAYPNFPKLFSPMRIQLDVVTEVPLR